MRISDWSSDVCSSDLARLVLLRLVDRLAVGRRDGDNLMPQVADDHFDVHRADRLVFDDRDACARSEEHTSELQSLMRTSYAVFCLQKQTRQSAQTAD